MENNLKHIEVYKSHNIWDFNGCIAVNKVTDGQEYLFIVGLDDSKTNGNRKFVKSVNNTSSAKKYIDWLTPIQ